MKNKEQKDAMIEALKKERQSLPEFSMFGSNNYEPIDARIDVIENDLDNSEIEIKYPWDEDLEENPINNAAEEARNWLDGQLDDEDMVDEEHLSS